MDNSVNRYRKRRTSRAAGRQQSRLDSVSAFRQRREQRLQERFDASARLAYGIAKSMGIKTEGMEPKEVWAAIKKKDPGAAEAAAKGYGNRSPKGSLTGKSGERSKQTSRAKYQGNWTPPKVKGMDAASVNQTLSECSKAGGQHYSKGTKVANEKPSLRTFTTHGMDHIQQVVEKTNQAADVIEQLKGNHRFQGAKMDRKLMLVSAWFHDTGMDGGNMDWSEDNGDGIRGNHGMNSAMHILEHSKELEKMGVNPSQAAFIAFAHTKSKSGVNDLMNPGDWKVGLDKIEGAVNDYNKRNPNNKIKFDRKAVFGGEPDAENIRHMASQVAAVRLGDANREANIPLRSQSGGKYDIDSMATPDQCGSWRDEVNNSKISIKDENGVHDLNDDKDGFIGELGQESRDFSKKVVLGERNMVKVDTVMDNGSLALSVSLRGGNDVPHCTVEALLERCGELNTINGIPRSMQIKMSGVKSAKDLHHNALLAYRDMWSKITDMTPDKKTGQPKYGGIDSVTFVFEDGSTKQFHRESSGGNNRGGNNQ